MESVCQKKNRIVIFPNFGGTVIRKYLKNIQQFCIIPFPIFKMHIPFPFLLTNKKIDSIFTPFLTDMNLLRSKIRSTCYQKFFKISAKLKFPLKVGKLKADSPTDPKYVRTCCTTRIDRRVNPTDIFNKNCDYRSEMVNF